MPKTRTVTTVTEYEYSEDGYVLKETKTQTTVEGDVPVAPYRQGPHIHFPVDPSPYKSQWGVGGYGGHLRTWEPGEHLQNGPITSGGISGAVDC